MRRGIIAASRKLLSTPTIVTGQKVNVSSTSRINQTGLLSTNSTGFIVACKVSGTTLAPFKSLLGNANNENVYIEEIRSTGNEGIGITDEINDNDGFAAYATSYVATPPSSSYNILFEFSFAGQYLRQLTNNSSINEGDFSYAAYTTRNMNVLFTMFFKEAFNDIEMLWLASNASTANTADFSSLYAAIFDSGNMLNTDGIFNSIQGDFYQYGNAADWNSGTDKLGNTYTVTGGFTDV